MPNNAKKSHTGDEPEGVYDKDAVGVLDARLDIYTKSAGATAEGKKWSTQGDFFLTSSSNAIGAALGLSNSFEGMEDLQQVLAKLFNDYYYVRGQKKYYFKVLRDGKKKSVAERKRPAEEMDDDDDEVMLAEPEASTSATPAAQPPAKKVKTTVETSIKVKAPPKAKKGKFVKVYKKPKEDGPLTIEAKEDLGDPDPAIKNRDFYLRAVGNPGKANATYLNRNTDAATKTTYKADAGRISFTIKVTAWTLHKFINHVLLGASPLRTNILEKMADATPEERAEEIWSEIQKHLGQFIVQAYRLASLLYDRKKGIPVYGKMCTPVAANWLAVDGAFVNKRELVRQAVNLGPGNQMKSLAWLNSYVKRVPGDEGAVRKRSRISGALENSLLHPAQKYLARSLGRKSEKNKFEVAHARALISSMCVIKPKMKKKFYVPLAYFDGGSPNTWQGHIEMFLRRLNNVFTADPQLPIILMMNLGFENAGIVDFALGQTMTTRSEMKDVGVHYYPQKTVKNALAPQRVFPPLVGSASDSQYSNSMFISGSAVRVQCVNKDRFSPEALIANEDYASCEAAAKVLMDIIRKSGGVNPTEKTDMKGANTYYAIKDGKMEEKSSQLTGAIPPKDYSFHSRSAE